MIKSSMGRRYVVLLLCFSVICQSAACLGRTRVLVNNQEEFNDINSHIEQCLSEGAKDIEVCLKSGTYYFHNNHVTINEINNPDLCLTIKGEKAIIIADGQDLSVGKSVRNVYGSGYIGADLSDVPNYSKMYQMDGLVEIVDHEKKICRVPCTDVKGISNLDWSCSKLELTSWYTSFTYDITNVADGYIYFYANNLAEGLSHYGNYNVNYDYTVGKLYPRFRVVNMPLGGCVIASDNKKVYATKADVIHQCEASRFLTVSNSKIKKLSVTGIQFVGNNHLKTLVDFDNVGANNIRISKCSFSCMRSVVVKIVATNNVIVEGCEFYDNYSSEISIANSSDSTIIRKNSFHDNGKSLRQNFCIVCKGGAYSISQNEIYDFNYGAIGVGVWHGDKESNRPCYGVVERNHIYHTNAYKKKKATWTLIDSGAIYVWTRNAGAIIRNNFVHDYSGMDSNRGIYCDDGAYNCSVYGNIVLNIENFRGIDLRRSKTIENAPVGQRSNENNQIFGNVFNNDFLFEGRDDDSTSIKGGNTILVNSKGGMPKIIVKNVVEESQDRFLKYKEKVWYKKGRKLVR